MTPLERAELSLEGLSIGDAFGQKFFGPTGTVRAVIERRALPAAPWSLTDDSIMAIAVVETLRRYGSIEQDFLAQLFAENFRAQPHRGYGAMAQHILAAICSGERWQDEAPAAFGGSGSYGNGAAMRVAPLGAYYAHDPQALCIQALRSAEVTHAHPEGQAGAIAIAAAAAWAWTNRAAKHFTAGPEFLDHVLRNTPDGETRDGIAAACNLPLSERVETAVAHLGNGSMISSQDTVPFALWCAARHLESFEDALWTTVSGLGDRDTTCAMVGGIVALRVGRAGIPNAWRESRESLAGWTPPYMARG